MIKFINLVRTKPVDFAKIIKDHIPYIQENTRKHKKSNFYIQKPNICKIGLIKGPVAFEEAAERLILGDLLEPLEYREDLCMQISSEREDWTNKVYLDHYLQDKAEYLNYSFFAFHFDLDCVCPLTSTVLQVVDDNCFHFQRRDNILNPEYKYIGVTNKKIGNSFCVYISFAG